MELDDDDDTYALKKIISPSYFLNSRCNVFGKLVTLNGPLPGHRNLLTKLLNLQIQPF